MESLESLRIAAPCRHTSQQPAGLDKAEAAGGGAAAGPSGLGGADTDAEFRISRRSAPVEYTGKVIKVVQSATHDVGKTGKVISESGCGSEKLLKVQFDIDGYEEGIVTVMLKNNKVEVLKDPPPIAFRCARPR